MRNVDVDLVSQSTLPHQEATVNSHFLLRMSSMQFGLDGRVDEPLVPIPKRLRWRRRSTVSVPASGGTGCSPPGADPEETDADRQAAEPGGRR